MILGISKINMISNFERNSSVRKSIWRVLQLWVKVKLFGYPKALHCDSGFISSPISEIGLGSTVHSSHLLPRLPTERHSQSSPPGAGYSCWVQPTSQRNPCGIPPPGPIVNYPKLWHFTMRRTVQNDFSGILSDLSFLNLLIQGSQKPAAPTALVRRADSLGLQVLVLYLLYVMWPLTGYVISLKYAVW